MNTARNWKWILPAVAVPGLFVVAVIFQDSTQGMLPIMVLFSCQIGMVALMIISAVAAAANFRNYFGWEELDRFQMRQRALNTTPVTLLADSLRQMHPEAVKVLNRFGVKTVWQVRIGSEAGDRDWILLDTNVHMAFIEYVLDHSNMITLMQKRTLSEGSFKWDPNGLVNDYEQYDEFLAWLIGRLMVTRPFGNMSAQWIPPWKPDVVKERMGLTEDEPQELVKE
jgi:hypothetical protein